MKHDLFKRITEFQDTTFPNSNAMSKLHHLSDEVIELMSAIQQDEPGERHEFADCFLLLIGAAAKRGMTLDDITACMEEKLAINLKRQWGAPDENGVVKHIKPTL